MKYFSAPYVLIFALALLAGCNTLSGPANGQIEESNTWVLEALNRVQRIANAGAEEQRHEMTLAQQAFARDKSVASRLQLGLLLAMPNIAGNDENRALSTLEPLMAHPHPAVRALAAMTSEQIQERLRLGKKAKGLQDQLEELKNMERSLIERSAPRKK